MRINLTHKTEEVFRASNESNEIDIGRGDCFRPMELFLTSLTSCASIDILLILKKQRICFDKFSIQTDGERDESQIPAVFNRIVIKFHFSGETLPLNPIKRAIRLSVEKYCSISAMLNPNVKIDIHLILNNIPYEI